MNPQGNKYLTKVMLIINVYGHKFNKNRRNKMPSVEFNSNFYVTTLWF